MPDYIFELRSNDDEVYIPLKAATQLPLIARAISPPQETYINADEDIIDDYLAEFSTKNEDDSMEEALFDYHSEPDEHFPPNASSPFSYLGQISEMASWFAPKAWEYMDRGWAPGRNVVVAHKDIPRCCLPERANQPDAFEKFQTYVASKLMHLYARNIVITPQDLEVALWTLSRLPIGILVAHHSSSWMLEDVYPLHKRHARVRKTIYGDSHVVTGISQLWAAMNAVDMVFRARIALDMPHPRGNRNSRFVHEVYASCHVSACIETQEWVAWLQGLPFTEPHKRSRRFLRRRAPAIHLDTSTN